MIIISFKKTGNRYEIEKKEPERLLDECLLLQNKVYYINYLLKEENLMMYRKEIVEQSIVFAKNTLNVYKIEKNYEKIYKEMDETIKESMIEKEGPIEERIRKRKGEIKREDIKDMLREMLRRLHYMEFEITAYHLDKEKREPGSSWDREEELNEHIREIPRMGFHLKHMILKYAYFHMRKEKRK